MPKYEDDLPDLDGLTTAQRAVVALGLVHKLLQTKKSTGKRSRGRPKSETGKATIQAAKMVGIGKTSVETAIAIEKRDASILDRMSSGELNVSQAARLAGLSRGWHYGQMTTIDSAEHDAMGRTVPLMYYGKGDKWKEAAGPLLRYLTAWKRRGYEFRHVAPKEARRRLALIAELEVMLDAAKVDLEQRAHSATLTVTKKG